MTNKRIGFYLIICFILALSMACGSSTKLMTLNLDQALLDSILHDARVMGKQSDFTFEVLESEIGNEDLRVDGDINLETGNENIGYINFAISTQDGMLIFRILETNMAEIQSEEVIRNEISEALADLVYLYLAEGRDEVEIITADIVDNVFRISFRFQTSAKE